MMLASLLLLGAAGASAQDRPFSAQTILRTTSERPSFYPADAAKRVIGGEEVSPPFQYQWIVSQVGWVDLASLRVDTCICPLARVSEHVD